MGLTDQNVKGLMGSKKNNTPETPFLRYKFERYYTNFQKHPIIKRKNYTILRLKELSFQKNRHQQRQILGVFDINYNPFSTSSFAIQPKLSLLQI